MQSDISSMICVNIDWRGRTCSKSSFFLTQRSDFSVRRNRLLIGSSQNHEQSESGINVPLFTIEIDASGCEN